MFILLIHDYSCTLMLILMLDVLSYPLSNSYPDMLLAHCLAVTICRHWNPTKHVAEQRENVGKVETPLLSRRFFE